MSVQQKVRAVAGTAVRLLACLGVTSFAAATSPVPARPPATRVEAVVETLHGVQVRDPYRWLEDQESAETRAWIDAQNAYTKAVLGALPGREELTRRLSSLSGGDFVSPPLARSGRYFFVKRAAGASQPAICFRQGVAGGDQVLLDPSGMSPDHTTSVDLLDASADGKVIAYSVREGGEDEYSVGFLRVDGRQAVAERLPKARYSPVAPFSGVALTPDGGVAYYSRLGKEGWRIFRHALGSDPAADALIFGEGRAPEQILQADLAPDGRYLAVYVRHGVSDDKVEVWVQNLAAKGPFSPIVDDLDASFYGLMADGHLFLRTNWKAPRWRIFDVDLGHLKGAARDRSRWREVVPESAAVLTDVSLVGGKIVASYLDNVSSRIRVFEASGRLAREIPLPTLGSTGDVRGSWDSDEAFYDFTSFVTPPLVYRVSVATGRQEIWKKPDVAVAGAEIEVRQVWYPSKDGTHIPMFVVMKKGAPLDGDRPTWMTGYGGFNISLSPYFDPEIALWVEAGGAFAQPNLRGGGELGEEWHRAGMLDRKQNTFDDFASAAEWLVANRYTRPARLAIQGGSNGGLLVGAAITRRPDLFQAAIAEFPLLDMVRYHRFLVANRWIPEYGSADDEKQFQTLYRYSPYHHVVDGTKYPAVLLVTGDADTRVAPLHARKMTARLQAATASDRPILLQYALKAGHSGGLSREAALAGTADQLVFLFWQLGAKPLPLQP